MQVTTDGSSFHVLPKYDAFSHGLNALRRDWPNVNDSSGDRFLRICRAQAVPQAVPDYLENGCQFLAGISPATKRAQSRRSATLVAARSN